MKVTLIYPDVSPITQTFMQGIGYLSSVLKNAGHEVSLIHVRSMPEREDFIAEVKKNNPDLIGFSVTSNMFPLVVEWSSWIKEEMDIPIICGGKHVTLVPDESIKVPSLDMLCIGEGEEALLELCDSLEQGKDFFYIKNIWVKKNGFIFKNEPRPLREDLDTLPFPDRTVFDYPNLACSKDNIGLFMASRGCPYDCYYCCNLSLRKTYANKGKYVRFRSVDNLLKEMKEVLNSYQFIKTIAFDDDIVPLYKDWFREFITRYKKEINMPFYMNVRPNLVDEEVADLLKEAGCQQIRFGLESGNEYISDKILNRKLTNNQIKKAFNLCRERRIRTLSYNMVGIPEEDMECILDTIKLNAEIGTNDFAVSIFYPYQKTKLYDMCLEKNMLTGKASTSYFKECTITHDKLTKGQIEFAKKYFIPYVRLYAINRRLPGFLSQGIERYLDKCFKQAPKKHRLANFIISRVYNLKNILKKIPLVYRGVRKLKHFIR